jgi:tetratricopeptide (TPR) repeat protein
MWKNIFGTKYDGNAVNEYKKGDDALGRDDYVAAISCFKEAIDIEPNFAEAYHSLGCAYFGINSAEDAIRSLETAIKLKCKGPNIYFYLGIAYISVGKEPYGRELINKAVGLGSKSAKLWVDKRESIKKAMPDYIKNCQIFYNYHYDLFGNSSCKTMIEYWQTNTEANETFSELSDQIAKLCMKDYELNYRELIRKAFPGLTDEFINHNEEIIKKARKDVRILMHCNYDEPTFDVQNIPTCSKQMAFDKAHKSVEYLGLQAYEIFMQEYKSSEMIQSTIQ